VTTERKCFFQKLTHLTLRESEREKEREIHKILSDKSKSAVSSWPFRTDPRCKEIFIKFSHRFRAGMNKRVWRECVWLVEDSLPRVANDSYGWGDFCIPGSGHIFPFYKPLFRLRIYMACQHSSEFKAFIFSVRVFQLSLRCLHSFPLLSIRKHIEHNFSDSNIVTGEKEKIKSFIINISII